MKNKTASYRILFTWLLLALSSWCGAQQVYLPQYTTKNGLPGNNCYFLMQDRHNFIWIATDAGVSRFDGKVFENFSVDDGLPDNQILQVSEDRKGRIWFLALNGQMSYFLNGRIYNASNDRLLRTINFNASIISLLEDSRGRLWLSTSTNKLGMWDGQKLTTYVSADNNAQLINAYVHEDGNGTIRAYNTQATQVFTGNGFRVESNRDLPLSYKTFLPYADGRLLFLQKDGLYVRDNGKVTLRKKLEPKLLSRVTGYFYADEDEIWLSSNNGVEVIGETDQSRFLEDMPVNQVMKDREGNFWLATGSGIYMLPVAEERLYIVNRQTGLSNDKVHSVLKDPTGRIWLGLASSIDIVNTSWKRLNTINIPDKSKYARIKQLNFNLDSSAVYFASDNGVGRFAKDQLQPDVTYLKEANNLDFVIKNFSLGPNNTLAMALSSATVIVPFEKGKFEFNSANYRQQVNYFKDRSYSVYYDANNILWFANINGLYAFDGKKQQPFFDNDQLLTKRINDIAMMQGSVMAMATDGYGIVLVDKGKLIRHVTTRDGLSSNICTKLFYKNGVLWTITNVGVNRIIIRKDEVEVRTFEYAADLLAGEVNDIFVDDNYAYFATNNGLIFLASVFGGKDAIPPSVNINSILVDQELVNYKGAEILIPSSYNSITFNYTAVDFKNRNMLYRYRLKNTAAWTETRNNRLEFSSLEPGAYQFEVAARGADGSWGDPTAISFRLQRTLWQSAWFWILLSVVAAFALYKIAVTITQNQKNKEKAQLMMKNKILTLEQQALQALMNPHFIFNVMNSIQHFINTQDRNAANKTLTGFARLIRKNLEICTKSFISIEEELEYLNLYLLLEKGRFGERFHYSVKVDPGIDKEEMMIPSMLLQPFVENAIWHGLMPKEEHGIVEISLRLNNNMLEIGIADNGVGYENSIRQKTEGHISKGMALTRERIRLINTIEQNLIQLTVKQQETGGTLVQIFIPIEIFNR